MPQMCSLCGRKPHIGNMIVQRGKAKRDGGVGKKTTGVTRRFFRPNLQRVRALVDGKACRIWSCTRCIRAGKVVKPMKKWNVIA
ncbi:MAG: large subunit ribosomal protein [Planctomycetota bacterium]|nr:MAG: large subunit ribosomal protein [Planctomycetota bacterium]